MFQDCTKPLIDAVKQKPSKEPDLIKSKASKTDNSAQIAAVALSDCLACSGCVTSAETVLLEQQSLGELLKVASNKEDPKTIVFAVSTPSRIALASSLGIEGTAVIDFIQDRFRQSGISCTVIDMSFAEQISLQLTIAEASTSETVVLTSHCPGWSLYAEKTQSSDVTNRLSKIRSPDQIAGILVKELFPIYACQLKSNPWLSRFARLLNPIYFVTISPCFDKKLEILRPGYKLDDAQIVDLSLTTSEVLAHLNACTSTSAPAPQPDLSTLLGLRLAVSAVDRNEEGGGYAEAVAGATADWETRRNRDLTSSGGVVRAYGFRNIQNIVRRFKELKKSKLIEVMACPGACTLGGGQPTDAVSDASRAVHVKASYRGYTGFSGLLGRMETLHGAEASDIFSAQWKSLGGVSSIKW